MKVRIKKLPQQHELNAKHWKHGLGGNLFGDGGDEDKLIDWIIREEGFLPTPKNIGDGKITLGSGLTNPKWHELYRKRGNKWSEADNRKAVAEEIALRRLWAEQNIPNWQILPVDSQNAVLSYKYNYDFNENNSPKMYAALKAKDWEEAAKQMDATSSDPKFKKGLEERRLREQKLFLSGFTNSPMGPILPKKYANYQETAEPVSIQPILPFLTEQPIPAPIMVPDENQYVSVHTQTQEDIDRKEQQRAIERLNNIERFNRLMNLINVQNNPTPTFVPQNAPYTVNTNAFGGNLFDGFTQPTQQMDKTYDVGFLPEVTVTAPKRWFVGYDDNANPIYTTNYTQSQEYLQNQLPIGNTEQRRNQWAFENIGSNGQVRPGLHGDAADLAKAAQLGIGTALAPLAVGPLVEASMPVMETIARPTTTATRIASKLFPQVSTALPYTEMVDRGIMGVTGATGMYNTGKDWYNGEIPWYQAVPQMGLEGLMMADASIPVYTELANKYPGIEQYPRYIVGKFKYGFDAELPTLYRKIKTLPKVENGKINISTPNNRFAFDNGLGEESPLITNFTTDIPVRSHGAGNWDRAITLAFPGKTLLGNKVISTRPSDTFVYGDNISVPIKEVTGFTGRPKEIDYLAKNGISTISSSKTKALWHSEAKNLSDEIAKARKTNAKIFDNKRKGKYTVRPKTPTGNFDAYATEIENLARMKFKTPTLKDYEFMDYVFKPKYNSEVIPVVQDFTIRNIEATPYIGSWIGDDTKRRYLTDTSLWRNVMYDPATEAEDKFRKGLNIYLKPQYRPK